MESRTDGGRASLSDPFETDPRVLAKVGELMAELRGGEDLDAMFASERLAEIGRPSVEPLCALLSERGAAHRYFAAAALGEIGPDAEAAVPALIEALADADPELRSGGLEALGRIARRAELCLPALRAALRDPAPSARVYAAAGVLVFSANAEDAQRELRAGLRAAPSDIARCFAAKTLGGLPASEAAVSALVAALGDPHPNVRKDAAAALGELGPAARSSIDALVPLLNDPDVFLRTTCVRALGKMGWDGWPALLGLTAALAQRREPLDPKTREVIDRAARVLGARASGEVNVAVGAAAALEAITPGHDGARAVLRAVMLSSAESPEYRILAAERLARAPGDPEALRILTFLASSGDQGTRREAARALARLGRPEGVPALVEALSFDNRFVRLDAARSLGSLGPAAREAVAGLTEAARDPFNAALRREAVRALASIAGPAAIRLPASDAS